MKKLLSILLALVLVLGMGAAATASTSNDRITGVLLPLDTNNSFAYSYISPGTTVQFPLTADMFSWSSGRTGGKDPISQRNVSVAGMRPVLSGTTTGIVKNISIKHGSVSGISGKTAVVEVEFVKPFVSTSKKEFDFNAFLYIGHRQADSRVRMTGSLQNNEINVSSSENYVDLEDSKNQTGQVLVPSGSVRNLEIHIGDGVTLITNVFNNQRYYGYAENIMTPDDDKVLTSYPRITDVLRLTTINLKKTGNYVDLKLYGGRYVYGQNGAYLGQTSQLVAYSDVYYLSSQNYGSSITAGSGTGTTPVNPVNPTTPTTPVTPVTPTLPSIGGTIGRDEAIKLANAAVTKAKQAGSKTASISAMNQAEVTADGLKAMNSTAVNAGMSSQFHASTVVGKAVDVRLTLFPGYATNLTTTTQLGAHISGGQVDRTKAAFQKQFSNKIAVLSLNQNGSFGMTVSIAARVNLTDFNKNNIYFYSFNRGTNKYYILQNPQAWIDTNGYIRFNTNLGGDIIITEGPLALR